MTTLDLIQMKLVEALLAEIDNQYPGANVLSRQFNSIIDAANMIVREFKIGEIMSVAESGVHAWRKTDQVGVSSDYMAAQLGGFGIREYGHPHDPADFGRCLTMLEAAPDLRDRLPEMALKSPQWAALVEHWDELEALWIEESPSGKAPKMYAKMDALLYPKKE